MKKTDEQIRNCELKFSMTGKSKNGVKYIIFDITEEFIEDMDTMSKENPVWFEQIGKAFVKGVKEA